ncbi:MAG: PTS glucose transporter subunit IIA [Clostridia bacterium]|nr:PTS glucose transporter subunit IIA [Clostridia bacterium]
MGKKDEKYLLAVQTGKVISIRKVPDEVFSEKILGDGVAIIPSEDDVVSPVDGEIVQIAETGHAFCIRSEDGVDILIHIGIDTVNLKGEGFESFVSVGQKVKAGDKIGKANIKLIKEKGYPIHTAVVITNMNDLKDMKPIFGNAKIGETKIVSYRKK